MKNLSITLYTLLIIMNTTLYFINGDINNLTISLLSGSLLYTTIKYEK